MVTLPTQFCTLNTTVLSLERERAAVSEIQKEQGADQPVPDVRHFALFVSAPNKLSCRIITVPCQELVLSLPSSLAAFITLAIPSPSSGSPFSACNIADVEVITLASAHVK